eukprot:12676271-Ditylum_brightwellii.AAC.1
MPVLCGVLLCVDQLESQHEDGSVSHEVSIFIMREDKIWRGLIELHPMRPIPTNQPRGERMV